GGWIRYAKQMESAGASALELNVYYLSTEVNVTSARLEQNYYELVSAVRETISIPLSVKIGPFFSSLPNFAKGLVDAGANGLVLFNRFLQPDLDVERMVIDPRLELSQRVETRLPMRWIAILDPQLDISLAANSGIHSANDIFKLLLVGADVVMMTSALLKFGAQHLKKVDEDLREWCVQREYRSIDQLRGSMSRANCPDASALERGNYMKALQSYTA
ncbi:MAG: tRNA-dihydrouridine synthase, partial [Planctomycetales bacterium]|nr:tRNA-dihydrouridine synthase [Planctomycetales bacterium]